MLQKNKLLIQGHIFLKAAILCDDFAFTENAVSTLARVGRQINVNVQWITHCWPMNALNEVKLAKHALAEASDSHLIVLSAKLARPLPLLAFDWLIRWAAVRTIQNAALGIIKTQTDSHLADFAFSKLSTFAREQGLNLIVDDSPARSPVRVPVRFRTERKIAFPIAKTYLTDLCLRESYREFGINE